MIKQKTATSRDHWETRFCYACGKEIDKTRSRDLGNYKSRRYCSDSCRVELHEKVLEENRQKKAEERAKWPDKRCPVCGKAIRKEKYRDKRLFMAVDVCGVYCKKVQNCPEDFATSEYQARLQAEHDIRCREFSRRLESEVRRRAAELMIDIIHGRIPAPELKNRRRN